MMLIVKLEEVKLESSYLTDSTNLDFCPMHFLFYLCEPQIVITKKFQHFFPNSNIEKRKFYFKKRFFLNYQLCTNYKAEPRVL